LALSVARRVLGHGGGLERFQILIAGGCALGMLGVLLMTQVPGGVPRPSKESGTQRGQLLQALRDRNFIAYLGACGSTTCGLALCNTFLPVFLKEQLSLPVATVVTLDIVALASGAAVALLCGWAADRVGSRPMLMPIVVLAPVIPLGWLVIPRHSAATVPWCCALYFLTGAATVGSTVVAARLLANGVVPRERNGTYLSIHYAWMGTVGGASCLAAGGILALCERWRAGGANVEGHSLLFLLAFGLLAAGGGLYSRVRPDDRFTTREVLREIFAGCLNTLVRSRVR
jgi:MFS-type transporter involved in bile tolerance (Atg22 family)